MCLISLWTVSNESCWVLIQIITNILIDLLKLSSTLLLPNIVNACLSSKHGMLLFARCNPNNLALFILTYHLLTYNVLIRVYNVAFNLVIVDSALSILLWHLWILRSKLSNQLTCISWILIINLILDTNITHVKSIMSNLWMVNHSIYLV